MACKNITYSLLFFAFVCFNSCNCQHEKKYYKTIGEEIDERRVVCVDTMKCYSGLRSLSQCGSIGVNLNVISESDVQIVDGPSIDHYQVGDSFLLSNGSCSYIRVRINSVDVKNSSATLSVNCRCDSIFLYSIH